MLKYIWAIANFSQVELKKMFYEIKFLRINWDFFKNLYNNKNNNKNNYLVMGVWWHFRSVYKTIEIILFAKRFCHIHLSNFFCQISFVKFVVDFKLFLRLRFFKENKLKSVLLFLNELFRIRKLNKVIVHMPAHSQKCFLTLPSRKSFFDHLHVKFLNF